MPVLNRPSAVSRVARIPRRTTWRDIDRSPGQPSCLRPRPCERLPALKVALSPEGTCRLSKPGHEWNAVGWRIPFRCHASILISFRSLLTNSSSGRTALRSSLPTRLGMTKVGLPSSILGTSIWRRSWTICREPAASTWRALRFCNPPHRHQVAGVASELGCGCREQTTDVSKPADLEEAEQRGFGGPRRTHLQTVLL
jgi:hypothetical protein